VTDKRKVRRDLADIFCTTSEGVRADRAKDWKLIDGHAKPQQFGEACWPRSAALRASPPQRPAARHRAHAARR
jgi:benzoyl-CoA-dihydrodiol lyase